MLIVSMTWENKGCNTGVPVLHTEHDKITFFKIYTNVSLPLIFPKWRIPESHQFNLNTDTRGRAHLPSTFFFFHICSSTPRQWFSYTKDKWVFFWSWQLEQSPSVFLRSVTRCHWGVTAVSDLTGPVVSAPLQLCDSGAGMFLR